MKSHVLKSGKEIQVRTLDLNEAAKLIELKRSYILGTTTIPLLLEEYPIDIPKEQNLISQYNESSNGILLVAEYQNELIGNIDITGSTRSKTAHTAMLGMGIKAQWRNQGLGTILIQSVIDWAKESSQLKLIWLDVYASNELGFNLYKNMGFEVSGVIKNFFKDENGFQDKIQMYLTL